MALGKSTIGFEIVTINNRLQIGKQITVPDIVVVASAFSPPPIAAKSAIGVGPDGMLYVWKVATSEWVLAGGDSSNWTSNNSFAS